GGRCGVRARRGAGARPLAWLRGARAPGLAWLAGTREPQPVDLAADGAAAHAAEGGRDPARREAFRPHAGELSDPRVGPRHATPRSSRWRATAAATTVAGSSPVAPQTRSRAAASRRGNTKPPARGSSTTGRRLPRRQGRYPRALSSHRMPWATLVERISAAAMISRTDGVRPFLPLSAAIADSVRACRSVRPIAATLSSLVSR